jgi:hypothetical protein
MDCMDCHNRPSHGIAATPERAVDERMAAGVLPKTLPFIRREAVKALKVNYPSHDAAGEGIARTLRDFYRTRAADVSSARTEDVEKAVQATANIYYRQLRLQSRAPATSTSLALLRIEPCPKRWSYPPRCRHLWSCLRR